MFLSSENIEKAIQSGDLAITGFDPGKLKAGVYRLGLAKGIRIPKVVDGIVDIEDKQEYDEFEMGGEGFVLLPGQYVVGVTIEKITLNNKFIGFVPPRSSLALKGLNITLSSFLLEPDTDNPVSIEIHNVSQNRIRLREGVDVLKALFAPIGGIEPMDDVYS